MKEIPIELETYEKLKAITKKQKLTVDQYVSKIIREEMKHPPKGMAKHAEDILAKKDLDYLRGFLDCALLLNDEAQGIPHVIPAPKPFDRLASRIGDILSISIDFCKSYHRLVFTICRLAS